MRLKNLVAAEAALERYIPAVKDQLGKYMDLARLGPLLEAAGNPHESLKVIHVVGTSGKTSTCYYLAALLTETGKKTGLTVSPHIDSITERLQINMQPLSEAQFCELLGEFLELIKTVEPQPTYFELLIVFVLWSFLKLEVEYAVLETGLGGLLDATNVVVNPNKRCVITDIGLDHTEILGNTLAEIATQKAGIIHAGNHVYMYEQVPEIMQAIRSQVKLVGASLETIAVEQIDSRLIGENALPLYQKRNWHLAKYVYDAVASVDKLPELTKEQLEKTLSIQVPGRMERLQVAGKTLIMDGAHNQQKMTQFVRSFQNLYPNMHATVMLALKTDKEYREVIDKLKPITDSFIFTTFQMTQDLPHTAVDPQKLAEYAKQQSLTHYKVIDENKQAFAELLASSSELIIMTGSLYLLSQVRAEQHLA